MQGIFALTSAGGKGVPADAVFVHLPVLPVLAVEDVVGLVDILLQSLRDLPLRVVGLWRWRGDVSAGDDFPGVGEDGLAPPLELAVSGGWQAADEGTCRHVSNEIRQLARFPTYPWKEYTPAHPLA